MSLRLLTLTAAALLMAGVFALDYAAGRDFDLWLLYILPIALAAFVLGPRHGYLMSMAATALLFLSGYLLGNPYGSTLAFMVDRGSEGLVYLLISYLIGAARVAIADADMPPPPPRRMEAAPR